MANTFNSGVHKEDWAVKLQERLNKPSNWKEVSEVIFSDTYIFNLPYMSTEYSATTGTRGTAYTFSDFALTNDTLTVNVKKMVPVFIDRADMAQIAYNNQMETATRQGALLSDTVETAMLADYGNWTDVGENAGVVTSGDTTQFTVTSTNIDDIVRGVRRIITKANGEELANRNGIFFVWRPEDFEALEQFAQANGFNLADAALKSGIDKGYHLLGVDHYVSNSHTANHVMAGVKKIFKIGILRATWGQIVLTTDPSLLSGFGIVARADFGVLSPASHQVLLYDVNVV